MGGAACETLPVPAARLPGARATRESCPWAGEGWLCRGGRAAGTRSARSPRPRQESCSSSSSHLPPSLLLSQLRDINSCTVSAQQLKQDISEGCKWIFRAWKSKGKALLEEMRLRERREETSVSVHPGVAGGGGTPGRNTPEARSELGVLLSSAKGREETNWAKKWNFSHCSCMQDRS